MTAWPSIIDGNRHGVNGNNTTASHADVTTEDEECPTMITISLMGQLQTADGEGLFGEGTEYKRVAPAQAK